MTHVNGTEECESNFKEMDQKNESCKQKITVDMVNGGRGRHDTTAQHQLAFT